jgi:hypothetical protein
MKQLIIVLALAFLIMVGVVIGTRMSSDALAVLVGVIAGVAASIPCALLLLAVTRRREPEVEVGMPYPEPRRAPAPPPVIVVTGGASQPQFPYPGSYAYGGQYGGQQAGPQRQFRVMGTEGDDEPPIEGEVERVDWMR